MKTRLFLAATTADGGSDALQDALADQSFPGLVGIARLHGGAPPYALAIVRAADGFDFSPLGAIEGVTALPAIALSTEWQTIDSGTQQALTALLEGIGLSYAPQPTETWDAVLCGVLALVGYQFTVLPPELVAASADWGASFA